MLKGSYILLLSIMKDVSINVGSLGPIRFCQGTYSYTGSALLSLEKRLARHATKQKKAHWHLDYVTNSKSTKVMYAVCALTNSNLECLLSRSLSSLPICRAVAGFGSTDCESGCASHFYLMGAPINVALKQAKEVIERLTGDAFVETFAERSAGERFE